MISTAERRRAFARWLRTGLLPPARRSDGVEVKFNPYHDPRNGRFTFAPGNYPSYDPERAAGEARLAPGQRGRPPAPGGNIRAFQDPMTLEQTFPGLRGAPGGAVIAAASNIFDLTGPAYALQADLLQNWTRQVMSDIQALIPNWRHDRLGPVTTLQGRINELNNLRFERAAVLLRSGRSIEPMQVETLRFLQDSTDRAYESGIRLLQAGKLKSRLSGQEALGNYIDREVRRDLRSQYNKFGIPSDGSGPIRVNRRENDTSGTESSFRRPDARVANVAYDVTIAANSLKTAQVRGFFSADFKPTQVVIIRPRQLGPDHTYIITRPRSAGQ